MDLFFREPTEKTPLIIFDPEQQKFEIIGVSVPENGKEFYQPVLDWLTGFAAKAPEKLTFVINLDYFNISSSKMLLFIFYKLMEYDKKGKQVKVIWFYNDDDLYEAGEDYEFITKLDFEFKKVSKSYLVT
jgi:hypothetical protein